LSLGSGPGHEILGCLERLGRQVRVAATCVDRDPRALQYGETLAVQKGLDGQVRYVAGNIFCMDALPTNQDIVVLSGLLDYFDAATAVSVLAKARERLRPGGLVLVANMRRHGLAAVMSLLGNWNLVYREPEDVERLLAEGGFCDIKVGLEPEKVFCVGRGQNLRTSEALAGQPSTDTSL